MSSYAVGGGKIDQEGFLKASMMFFRAGYVRGLNATQRGSGANMSVDVNLDAGGLGGAQMVTSAAIPYFGWINAVTNVSVAASSPSNPRIDVLVGFVNLAAISSAVTNNVGAFVLQTVTGTPAASPVAPNGAAIQTAIGAGNPYVVLANILVGTSVTSILNANITDIRTPAALQVPYLYGGASNTNGHLVPNQADGIVVTTTDTGSISGQMLSSGMVVQTTSANVMSSSTGSTVIPYDATIPQNTEGDQYLSRSITPKSATNRLLIEVTLQCSNSVANTLIAALFQDATANALCAMPQYQATATASVNLKLTYDMLAGTTSSTTFNVRVGGASAGTTTFNGNSGSGILGGAAVSNIKITEYKP